jgi:hypothetical protein
MKGRSPGHWAVILDTVDAATGRRKRKWHAVKGGKRERKRNAPA